MKLYFIRHGQTDWNIDGKIQGRTDVELNEEGIAQAEKLKNIVKDYNIDLIISSPLARARKTANIIRDEINCDIIFDEALIERDFGVFEGLTSVEIEEEESKYGKFNNYYLNVERLGVEPIKTLCDRVWTFIEGVKRKYYDKNILIVTHGGVMRGVEGYFNGINEDGDMLNPNIGNCQIRIYDV